MKQEELFCTGSVWKSIFTMALPSVVIIFVMFLYNVADMFFVGCLGDTAQVAAVSVVGPVFSILTAVATMLGAGGCAIIARCFGAGEIEQGKIYSSLCFWAGLFGGVVISVGLLWGKTALLNILGANAEIMPYADRYLQILALGAPFLVLANSTAMLIRAEGAVKDGLVGNLMGTLTNLLLDPLFILVWHFGVGGAAAASVLGNIVATLFYLRYIVRHGTVLTLAIRPALRKPLALGEIVALGLPNGISSLLSGFASTFSNRLLSGYGTDAIAAMAAAGKATMLISMIVMVLCMGCQPLLAYSYGAQDAARLKQLLRNLLLLTTAFGTAAGVLCFCGRDMLIGMFIQQETAFLLGKRLVVFLTLGSPVIGLTYLATNLLQAANRAAGAVVLSLLRQGILLILLLFLLNSLFGVEGIAAAHMAADGIAALISGIVLWKYARRMLAKPKVP